MRFHSGGLSRRRGHSIFGGVWLFLRVMLEIDSGISFLTSVSKYTCSRTSRKLIVTFFCLRDGLQLRCRWGVWTCCLRTYCIWETAFEMTQIAGYEVSCTPVMRLLVFALFHGTPSSIMVYGIFIPCYSRWSRS